MVPGGLVLRPCDGSPGAPSTVLSITTLLSLTHELPALELPGIDSVCLTGPRSGSSLPQSKGINKRHRKGYVQKFNLFLIHSLKLFPGKLCPQIVQLERIGWVDATKTHTWLKSLKHCVYYVLFCLL